MHLENQIVAKGSMEEIAYSYEKWSFDKFVDKKLSYKMDGLN